MFLILICTKHSVKIITIVHCNNKCNYIMKALHCRLRTCFYCFLIRVCWFANSNYLETYEIMLVACKESFFYLNKGSVLTNQQ